MGAYETEYVPRAVVDGQRQFAWAGASGFRVVLRVIASLPVRQQTTESGDLTGPKFIQGIIGPPSPESPQPQGPGGWNLVGGDLRQIDMDV